MVSLLKAEMLCHAEQSAGFLIDGFPRELENGDRLFKKKVMGTLFLARYTKVREYAVV